MFIPTQAIPHPSNSIINYIINICINHSPNYYMYLDSFDPTKPMRKVLLLSSEFLSDRKVVTCYLAHHTARK